MIVSINVNGERWKKLIKKYNLSGMINNFLKHLEDGDFANLEEVYAKE